MLKKIKNKKNKVLFIISFPPPLTGANISNQILWGAKIRYPFDCQLIDISDKRTHLNYGVMDFTNIYLGFMHLYEVFVKVRKFKPDIIYMLIAQNHWAYIRDGLFILLIKVISEAKIVAHLRGGAFFERFYDGSSWLMKRFIKYIQYRIHSFIVLGKGLRSIFAKWNHNVYVVPNGTDVLNGFTVEEKFANKKGAIYITFLSNLFKSKGIVEVVKSIKLVIDKFPDKKIVYKIAGSYGVDPDPVMGKLSAKAIKNEVEGILSDDRTNQFVDFLQVITGEEKLKLLKETDIFLLPTSFDGHPRAIIEAMAAGCPIISTPVGAITETVIDGETGFIIKPGDVNLLAEKIIVLIENYDLRKRISHASRRRYEEQYTENKYIENMINVFDSLLKR